MLVQAIKSCSNISRLPEFNIHAFDDLVGILALGLEGSCGSIVNMRTGLI